ncbi:MAG TPA: hypothetical protein VJ994_11570, partial [Paracoccaceae bacterium]|nr:hypothetical protein [Paracoccaceae bacterium]
TEAAEIRRLLAPVSDGAPLAWLHEHAEVLATRATESGMEIEARVMPEDFARFLRRFPDVREAPSGHGLPKAAQ